MPDARGNTPEVVYEDNHLLVLDKPAGWLVQGDHTGDYTLLDWGKKYIKERYQKPGQVFLHPVHRLDRPVSGLVVFSRTSKSLERLAEIFRKRSVSKEYLAIVGGRRDISAAELTHWIVKDSKKNIVEAYNDQKGNAKEAHLSLRPIAQKGKFSLLYVKPTTGRPHQIRVQLSAYGCPIQGDLKYGFPIPNKDKSISLHAFKLVMIHPVKKEEIILRSYPKSQEWSFFKSIINELD